MAALTPHRDPLDSWSDIDFRFLASGGAAAVPSEESPQPPLDLPVGKSRSLAPKVTFPPSLLPDYAPIRLLGVGGMGAVFLAKDRKLDRLVALKVAQEAANPVHAERFLREAAGLSRVRHPNLPAIYTFGRAGTVPFMALEYLEGEPLHQVPLPFDPLPAMLQVAEALAEIHAQGMVHRDVKPANIMLTRDGRAVLVDFGLVWDAQQSALTRTGKVVGTMNFLAPEQLCHAKPSPASDWYAWGVTLFALIERGYPYPVKDLVEAARRDQPLAPAFATIGATSPMARLLRRCLSLDPERRPRSRAEIEAQLQDAEVGEATSPDLPSLPPSTAIPTGSSPGRRPTRPLLGESSPGRRPSRPSPSVPPVAPPPPLVIAATPTPSLPRPHWMGPLDRRLSAWLTPLADLLVRLAGA